MRELTNALTLLAQNGGGGGPGFLPMPLMLLLLMVVFYLVVMRPEQQKRKRAEAQLKALKKNDRVVTAGGIYGVVAHVNREADEVIVKVDESNNTRLKFTLSAISRIVSEEAEAADEKK